MGKNSCIVDEATMRTIEQKARKLGIWGIAKKIKVVRSGDSLAIRIPADIAKLFNLHEGKEIFYIQREPQNSLLK